MEKIFLNKEQLGKWTKNILLFTAPALVVFFSLLAQGVTVEKAWPVALVALYGLVADYLKKLSAS